MGIIMSLVLCELGLISSGVLASVAAAKSTGEPLKFASISAAISFIVFVITLVIAIFLV